MSKLERFFQSLALVCVGVIIGFLISPIKKGVRITIGSNNTVKNRYGMDEDFDGYEYIPEEDESAGDSDIAEEAEESEEE